MKSYKDGFTLVECVLVLCALGVVIVLTLGYFFFSPNMNEKESLVRLKKFQLTLLNASQKAQVTNGNIKTWGWTADTPEGAASAMNNFIAKTVKTEKNCSTQTGCFPSSGYKNGEGSFENIETSENWAKAEMSDGTLIALKSLSPDCTYSAGTNNTLGSTCGLVFVDLNGKNSPTKWVKTAFYFG